MATPSENLGFQNFFSTTLTSGINDTDTTIPLDAVPNATEGFLVIDPDSANNREVIFYNSKTASDVTCPSAAEGRGQDDTSAGAHASGTTVIMAPVAGFYEALQSGESLADDLLESNPNVINADATDTGFYEIGRTTLGSAGDTITVDSLPARKYLKIIFVIQNTGGTADIRLQFNGDTGNNYGYTSLTFGGTGSTDTSRGYALITGAQDFKHLVFIGDMDNIAGEEKLLAGIRRDINGGGGANSPSATNFVFKWANTSAQVSSLSVYRASGTGTFEAGSEVVVYGKD